MRPLLILAAACLLMPLVACDESDSPPASTPLPPIPAELRTCLAGAGVEIPDGPLTVGQVERLWKQDRLRIVAMRQCGTRLLAFYDDLRRSWR